VAAAGAQQPTGSVVNPSGGNLSPHPSEQKSLAGGPESPGTPILLDAMTAELHRAFTSLGRQGASQQEQGSGQQEGQQESDRTLPPYFLSYAVGDATMVTFARSLGPW